MIEVPWYPVQWNVLETVRARRVHELPGGRWEAKLHTADTLVERTGYSMEQVEEALRLLEESGYIDRGPWQHPAFGIGPGGECRATDRHEYGVRWHQLQALAASRFPEEVLPVHGQWTGAVPCTGCFRIVVGPPLNVPEAWEPFEPVWAVVVYGDTVEVAAARALRALGEE